MYYKVMTLQDSYIERRQLFKNIWQTALDIDEKNEAMIKPKVIKTLRLDEVNDDPIKKSRREKIKNLRAVCNKILDYCDKQDAKDEFKQAGGVQPNTPITRQKRRKRKFIRNKRKSQTNLLTTNTITVGRVTPMKPENVKSRISEEHTNTIGVTNVRPSIKRIKLTDKIGLPETKLTIKRIDTNNDVSGDTKTPIRVVHKKRSTRKTKKKSSSEVGKAALKA